MLAIPLTVLKKLAIKRLPILLPLVSIAVGLILLIIDPLPLQALRNNVFDQYQRWYPRPMAEAPVRIVDIDEESLARLGQWPWPRTRLAELVARLKASDTAAIAFDMLLAEADRTSPQAMARLWNLPDGSRKLVDAMPDHDAVLASSFAEAGVVLGFVLQNPETPAPQMPIPHPFRYVSIGEDPAGHLASFNSLIPALPTLASAAAGYGALNFVADGDGIIRRVPLALNLRGDPLPSLTAEALRVAQGTQNHVLKAAASGAGLAEIRIGSYAIPTTAEGEIWLHYSLPQATRYLPAWKVIAGEVPRSMLEGHIVLIGSSAQGLMDLRFSPLGSLIPGVEAHAQALEQILSGQNLLRPGWARAVEVIAIVLGGLLIGLLSIRARALAAAGVAAGFLAVALAGGWYVFREYGLLLNTVTPSLIFALTFVVGSLIHHFVSEREQRWIKAAFSRYVSPNRVAYLIDHPETMTLGGGRHECSFIFTDLADFTRLMESMDPGDAMSMLNRYLDGMIEIAFRYEGTLDRIIGDAVAIMFSAPVAQSDHRARALACALDMDRFATSYAADLNARGIAFGKTRIGIHSGEVIVGNFGGSTMFDYRALGDPVNTASRLESVNKHLGTRICISEATLCGCPGAVVRPVGHLVLKGKTKAIAVFEPLTTEDEARYAPRAAYLEAYELLCQPDGSEAATAKFAALREQYPGDPLVDLQLRRLRQGENGSLIVLNEK
jgi:adenylate cyclase